MIAELKVDWMVMVLYDELLVKSRAKIFSPWTHVFVIPEVEFEDDGGLVVLEFVSAVFEQIEHTGQFPVAFEITLGDESDPEK